MGLLPPDDEKRLAAARRKLLARRGLRIRPGWDDKVLVDWNGLMIAALAQAAQIFAAPDWLALAEDAFAFIDGGMRDTSGRLKHAWRATPDYPRGRLAHPATLDDHANLARGALMLYQATGKPTYLTAAQTITADLDAHYWDETHGGYFFTADDTGDVIIRLKSAQDNATPSGNGTMVEVLARLHHLTGLDAYRQRGAALLAAFAGEIQRNFFPLANLLNGSDFQMNLLDVVILGAGADAGTKALLRAFQRHAHPHAVLQIVAGDAGLAPTHPASAKTRIGGKATAYLCRQQTCSAPVTDAAGLAAALSRRGRPG